jgi:hypothetical protein
MPKKLPKAATQSQPGATPPRQFRLGEDTLADLDLIAEHYTTERRKRQSRADAVRIAAQILADRIRKQRGEQK